MRCSSCGRELSCDDAARCPECGTTVDGAAGRDKYDTSWQRCEICGVTFSHARCPQCGWYEDDC